MASSVVVPKIKKTKDTVIKLLREQDNYKDNDEALVVRYWWDELPKDLRYTIRVADFLKMYRDGKLTSADIITRARRKAQEENPELRGTKWKMRHNEEELVREEINDTDSYRVDRSGGGYTP